MKENLATSKRILVIPLKFRTQTLGRWELIPHEDLWFRGFDTEVDIDVVSLSHLFQGKVLHNFAALQRSRWEAQAAQDQAQASSRRLWWGTPAFFLISSASEYRQCVLF